MASLARRSASCTASSFGIKSDNWFGIGFTQVHPAFGHIHLHTIHRVYLVMGILLLKGRKQAIGICPFRQDNFILRDMIIGILFAATDCRSVPLSAR